MNLVGTYWGVKSEKFIVVFKDVGKTKKKLSENGYFYAKPVFDKIEFILWCNSKKITVDT